MRSCADRSSQAATAAAWTTTPSRGSAAPRLRSLVATAAAVASVGYICIAQAGYYGRPYGGASAFFIAS